MQRAANKRNLFTAMPAELYNLNNISKKFAELYNLLSISKKFAELYNLWNGKQINSKQQDESNVTRNKR